MIICKYTVSYISIEYGYCIETIIRIVWFFYFWYRYQISTNLSSRVSHFNPQWNEPNADEMVSINSC